MAGIDLPKNSLFFKYSLLSDMGESTGFMGDNRIEEINLPDRRNCLYWNPYCDIEVGKENHFSFFTSDVPGIYQVIVQAISKNDGNPVFCESTFVVE